jgi:hypothetical protein
MPRLAPEKSYRSARMDDRPCKCTRRAIKTTWYVDGNDRFAGCVHGLDRCRRFTIEGAREPSAKECVDDKIGVFQHLGRKWLSGSIPSLRHHRSVSFQSIEWNKDNNTHPDTAFAEMAGRHKPVAAIVAWTAKYSDAPASPNEAARLVCYRTTRILHEKKALNARLDR